MMLFDEKIDNKQILEIIAKICPKKQKLENPNNGHASFFLRNHTTTPQIMILINNSTLTKKT